MITVLKIIQQVNEMLQHDEILKKNHVRIFITQEISNFSKMFRFCFILKYHIMLCFLKYK